FFNLNPCSLPSSITLVDPVLQACFFHPIGSASKLPPSHTQVATPSQLQYKIEDGGIRTIPVPLCNTAANRLPCGRPLLIGRGERRFIYSLGMNDWRKTMNGLDQGREVKSYELE
ncbi:hypothetical protein TNCV_1406171, partial [Trichonephila clavipes]